MRKIIITAMFMLFSFPAHAGCYDSVSLSSSGSLITVATVERGRKTSDTFYGNLAVTGTFNSATITPKISIDGGTTKIDVRNLSGTVETITEDRIIPMQFGWPNADGSLIFYASSSGSVSNPDLTATLCDNK